MSSAALHGAEEETAISSRKCSDCTERIHKLYKTQSGTLTARKQAEMYAEIQ